VARTVGRLTALQVQRAKKGKHHDGGGLYLLVHRGGSRSWAFRFGPQGRRYLGLGPLHTVSLAEARERARQARLQLLDGIDPIAAKREHRTAAKLESAKAVTFAECAARYFEAHRAGWRNAKHTAEWRSSLKAHAEPIIGAWPVQAIDTALVLKVLEPIWTVKSVTAGRVRGRIESVLDWAKARGYREGENPARWRGHLDHLLPATQRVKRVQHHVALPYAEIGAFMMKLRDQDGTAARCLEFIVLTAARLGEALNAEWCEIDLTAKVWVVPARRMKGGREHRVPLCDLALAVLKQTASIRYRDSELVFPGVRKGRPVDEKTIWRLAKDVGGDDAVTVHGLRSTFRDWAAERTNFANHVVEQALAHAIGAQVEAAYRRGDLLGKRRQLMEAWARYCSSPAVAGDVVALRRG
jgi:integrase